jgi:glycerophosphoryl diester phosphodiesterase
MKKALALFASLLLLFSLSSCAKPVSSGGVANQKLLQADITIENSADRILISAHRGYSKKYPENTMIAFEKALELDIDELEFDIQLSSDGVPVIMHDLTLDRTTNGEGNLSDFTLSQLKALDAGSWKNGKFKGEQIPTLEELLTYLQAFPGILLNVEIKQYTHETVDKTMALLKKYQLDNRYVITCFDADMLKYAFETYGVKCQGFPEEKMTTFDSDPVTGSYSYFYAVGIATKLLTPELVAEFQTMGIEPWSYTSDDDKTVKKHLAAGSRLLTCNNPLPAIKILKKQGLR